jgi:hypothetical protein
MKACFSRLQTHAHPATQFATAVTKLVSRLTHSKLADGFQSVFSAAQMETKRSLSERKQGCQMLTHSLAKVFAKQYRSALYLIWAKSTCQSRLRSFFGSLVVKNATVGLRRVFQLWRN